MLPNFIVIGGQKAGSTWVAEVLSHHPDVYMYPTEIPHFEDPDYHGRTLSDLEALYATAPQRKALGMKRPSLLTRPECPARIARDLPRARLIAMLRNPVERAVSSYFHLMRAGLLPVAPMEIGMQRVLAGKYDKSWPAGRERVLGYGFYYRGILRYIEHVPRSQMLILLYDRIRRDAAGLVRDMCAFLEIPAFDAPEAQQRRFMEGSYSFARQRVMGVLRGTYERVTDSHTRVRARRGPLAAAARKMFNGLDRVALARLFPAERPTPSAETQQQLITLFRDDVCALGDFLGADLSHWIEVREPSHGRTQR